MLAATTTPNSKASKAVSMYTGVWFWGIGLSNNKKKLTNLIVRYGDVAILEKQDSPSRYRSYVGKGTAAA